MKKIALVYNLNRGNSERETEFDTPETISFLESIILKKYNCLSVEASEDISYWVQNLIDYKPDLIFNISEGFCGPAREALYPAIFDQLKIRYCGPDATNLLICLNKLLTKSLLENLGITMSKGCVIGGKRINQKEIINFPCILKLNEEGSSIGMDISSIVSNQEELDTKASVLYKNYNRNIIVEEYIKGQDVSMAYIEGMGTLGPASVSYKKGEFYDYSLKSWNDSSVSIGTAKISEILITRLHDITLKIVKRLDIRGYAKIDFRIDDNNQIFFIEINGQVSFHPNGEFSHCCNASGYSLERSINHIIDHEFQRTELFDSLGVINV